MQVYFSYIPDFNLDFKPETKTSRRLLFGVVYVGGPFRLWAGVSWS